jgi:NADH-quinone oxidoreductase subunit J
MTAQHILFLIASLVVLVSGVMVVSSRNLVHAALALIVSFFGVALVFILLEAGFLAVVQVLLYIGAIAILIIFAIMLTRRVMQDSGPQTNSAWWLAGLMGVGIFAALAGMLWQTTGFQLTAAAPVPTNSIAHLGASFLDPNRYLIPFEVASVLLLAAMIGAIVIAGDKK